MSTRNDPSSEGRWMLFILFLVFLVLKLVGTIDWSWWWVTAPLWAMLVVAAVIFTVGTVVAIVGWILALIFKTPSQRKKEKNQAKAREALLDYSNTLMRNHGRRIR